MEKARHRGKPGCPSLLLLTACVPALLPLPWVLCLKSTWEKSSLRGCSGNQKGNHAVLPKPAITLFIFLLGCITLCISGRKQLSLQNRTNLVLSMSHDGAVVPQAAPLP